jgi:hypothetical protein
MGAEPKRARWRFQRDLQVLREEQCRKAREAWKAKARSIRLADYDPPPKLLPPPIPPPPEPKLKLERYRTIFPVPDMPEDSKPSWAAEGYGVRRLTCRRYETCLDYAAAKKWPGFDCTACPVEECSPFTREQR